jgi:hypothetical protein
MIASRARDSVIETLVNQSRARGTHPILPMTADGYVINLGKCGTVVHVPSSVCTLIGLAVAVWTRRAGSFDALLIGLHVS